MHRSVYNRTYTINMLNGVDISNDSQTSSLKLSTLLNHLWYTTHFYSLNIAKCSPDTICRVVNFVQNRSDYPFAFIFLFMIEPKKESVQSRTHNVNALGWWQNRLNFQWDAWFYFFFVNLGKKAAITTQWNMGKIFRTTTKNKHFQFVRASYFHKHCDFWMNLGEFICFPISLVIPVV